MDFEFPESDNDMSEILDLIGHKCSICFTADSEIELSICGDQFCFECLERLEESGWGIGVIQLDCPVCKQVLRDTSWMHWAGKELKELYAKVTLKKPQITRTCQSCGHEQSILGEEIGESLLYLFEALEEEIPEPLYNSLFRDLESRDLTRVLRHLGRQSLLGQTSPNLIYFLRKVLQESQNDDAGLFASKQLATLGICPRTFCDFCTAPICIRCSQSDWHKDMTCIEYSKKRLEAMEADHLEYSTLAWQVEHGKPCPKCFLLITKDDDGSCNQMRCSHCGFTFCWECLHQWSSSCGYYRCAQAQASDDSSDSKKSQKHRRYTDFDRTEAGIPDVTKLPSFRTTVMDDSGGSFSGNSDL